MRPLFRIFAFFLICQNTFGQDDSTNVKLICPTEHQASFPGGIDSLVIFFEKNLRLPTEIHECQGTVFVSFVVNEDGEVTDIEIIRETCSRLNKSIIDVFKGMPKWIPATVDGKPVRSRMILPFKFRASG